MIDEKEKLTLLCPESICSQYKMEEKTKRKLVERLRILQESLQAAVPSKAHANLKALVESVDKASAIEILPSEGKDKHIKREEIEEYNNYFLIQHVVTELPAVV